MANLPGLAYWFIVTRVYSINFFSLLWRESTSIFLSFIAVTISRISWEVTITQTSSNVSEIMMTRRS